MSRQLVQTMTWYKRVQKFNKKTQQYEPLFPLRVAGFAYELGWKRSAALWRAMHERGPLGERPVFHELICNPHARNFLAYAKSHLGNALTIH